MHILKTIIVYDRRCVCSSCTTIFNIFFFKKNLNIFLNNYNCRIIYYIRTVYSLVIPIQHILCFY